MNEVSYEQTMTPNRARAVAAPKPRGIPRWVAILTVVFIWLLIAVGCFMLAKYYIGDIQRQLDSFAATNKLEAEQLNVKIADLQSALTEHKDQAVQLQQQFTAVENELIADKEEMSLAGSSLSTTAETKQALNERINDLSKELTELRKLIKKLEEAARVY